MGVIDGIEAEARKIATDGPESDGTLEWADTTIVLARVRASGEAGVGYTYADRSVAALIEGRLGPVIKGRGPTATAACWAARAGAGAVKIKVGREPRRDIERLEHFHDHVRVEDEVFAAAPRPHDGLPEPPDRPGLGREPR